jgi:hypothetical protein
VNYAVPALIAALTLIVAGASAIAVPTAPESAVAAVFPPWWDREQAAAAVARSDGLIVREGAIATILVVRPAGPDLADRLRAHGAVLVVDPVAAGGCLGTGSA